MSLREAVMAEMRPQGGKCSVGQAREGMSPELLGELDDLLRDRAMPSAAIARALRSMNYELSESALNRHRAGDCKCR